MLENLMQASRRDGALGAWIYVANNIRTLALVAALGLFWLPFPALAGQKGENEHVEWVTLGTGGGPVVQLERAQPANALVVGKRVYIFDIGPGTLTQLKAAGIGLNRIEAIFLSHYHIDHTGGLGSLVVNRWVNGLRSPIPVIGPPGTEATGTGLAAMMRPVYQAPLAIGANAGDILSTYRTTDLPADMTAVTEIYRDDRVVVSAILNDHYHNQDGTPLFGFARSYAFRIEAGGRSIVYSGDTGPSDGLLKLARDADLLVAEAIDRDAAKAAIRAIETLSEDQKAGLLLHMDLNHMTGAEAARIAQDAGIKTLVLTHLVPGRDEEPNTLGYLRGVSDVFSGEVVLASDLDRF